MPKMASLFRHSYAARALLLFFAVQVSGCTSKEEQARNHYERGLKLFSEHDSAKAAIELRNAVRQKKDFIDGWKALAEVDEANGDWPRVASDLRAVVELSPQDISARLKLGKVLLLAGSTSEALTLINAGLDRDGKSADLHALKAAVTLKLDDRTGAVREAQIALGLDSANADALMVLAINRLSSGDANGALTLLEPVAGDKRLENNVGFQLLKIRLLRQLGDITSAEASLKSVIEQNPRELGYRKLLVNFYIEQHRNEDAERELRGVVATNPSDAGATLDLVQFLFSIKKSPADARRELNNHINAGGDIFPFQMALAKMDFDERNWIAGKELLEKLAGDSSASERKQMARIALAQMYLGRRNFDSAEKLANAIFRDASQNASALMIRATIHLERSQPEAAVPDLVSALASQPRSVELMLLLATAYERSGLVELADKQFASATTVSGFATHVGLEYANFLGRRGSPARAEEVLVGLTKRQPNNIQILSTLAAIRLARENWSGAREIADSMRRIGDDGAADQILGAALMGQGKYDDAVSLLQRAYQAKANAVQSMNSLTSAYLKANRKNEALVFLKSIVAKSPENANALVQLGSIQLSEGETDKAVGSFSAAVKAQPRDPVGYQALADLYQRQKKYDDAIGIIRKGLVELPDSVALQMTLAGVLDRKGDFEAAISQYESILDTQPGNLIVSNNLASLLLDHRTDGPSLKKAQSIAAILRNLQIPQFKDTLGWAKYRQGDYASAASLCEEAAAAMPDQAAVRYHLGLIYAAAGRPDKASNELKKALELTADGPLTNEMRNALEKVRQPPPDGLPPVNSSKSG
jgi:cellulose synthase operon protein C